MTKEETGSNEPSTEIAVTEAPAPRGRGATHWLVAGGAVATMLFVVALWVTRGGDLQSFEFAADDATTPAPTTAPAWTAPGVVTPTAPVAPAAAPATVPPAAAMAVVPGAVPPHAMPTFVAPHGVVNPLTMLHDPRYYQQWGVVAATYANPFAYQAIMNQVMLNSMRAWGMAPPATAATNGAGTDDGQG